MGYPNILELGGDFEDPLALWIKKLFTWSLSYSIFWFIFLYFLLEHLMAYFYTNETNKEFSELEGISKFNLLSSKKKKKSQKALLYINPQRIPNNWQHFVFKG